MTLSACCTAAWPPLHLVHFHRPGPLVMSMCVRPSASQNLSQDGAGRAARAALQRAARADGGVHVGRARARHGRPIPHVRSVPGEPHAQRGGCRCRLHTARGGHRRLCVLLPWCAMPTLLKASSPTTGPSKPSPCKPDKLLCSTAGSDAARVAMRPDCSHTGLMLDSGVHVYFTCMC